MKTFEYEIKEHVPITIDRKVRLIGRLGIPELTVKIYKNMRSLHFSVWKIYAIHNLGAIDEVAVPAQLSLVVPISNSLDPQEIGTEVKIPSEVWSWSDIIFAFPAEDAKKPRKWRPLDSGLLIIEAPV